MDIRRILNRLIEDPFEENTLMELYSFYKKHNLSEIHIRDKISKTPSRNLEGHITERYMSMVCEPNGLHVWHIQGSYSVIRSIVENRDIFTVFRKPNGRLSTSAFHNMEHVYIMTEPMDTCLQERLLNGKLVRIE